MRYKDFQPTMHDQKGAFLDDDRQNWLVVPLMQTRDSNCLDESNFTAALDILGSESDTVEVHRFNHWGPGWFEIILCHPSRELEVQAIEDSLNNYPVLDDEEYSRREWDKATAFWQWLSVKERIEWCRQYDISIFAARRDTIPHDPTSALLQALAK